MENSQSYGHRPQAHREVSVRSLQHGAHEVLILDFLPAQQASEVCVEDPPPRFDVDFGGTVSGELSLFTRSLGGHVVNPYVKIEDARGYWIQGEKCKAADAPWCP